MRLRLLLQSRAAAVGLGLILIAAVIAIAAPLVPLEDPERQDYDAVLAPPGADHPLGADQLGRDTLSRISSPCPWTSTNRPLSLIDWRGPGRGLSRGIR